MDIIRRVWNVFSTKQQNDVPSQVVSDTVSLVPPNSPGHVASSMQSSVQRTATPSGLWTAKVSAPSGLFSHSTEMSPLKIIPPTKQSAEDQRTVHLLSLMDQLLQEPSTYTKLETALKCGQGKASQSLRRIQGGRIEIFCRVQKRKSTVFDQLCESLHRQMKNHPRQSKKLLDHNHAMDWPYSGGRAVKKAILDYAMAQAQLDSRISDTYQYDNFSILVNYGPVESQTIHLDMQEPNFQFGLLLTNGTVPTDIYSSDCSIRSVRDLKERSWTDMPASLVQAIATDDQLPNLLRRFGDLLCPTISPVPLVLQPELQQALNAQPISDDGTPNSGTALPTGTLLSLPGSVIHAGPACDRFRAVLFFTAWPGTKVDNDDAPPGTNVTAPPYDPDTQYSTPSLTSDMAMVLWEKIGIKDRIYLLTKITESIHQSKYKGIFRHLKDPTLIAFTKAIGYDLCPKKDIPGFIVRFAIEWNTAIDSLDWETVDEDDRLMISAKNLEMSVDGEWCNVQVYMSNTLDVMPSDGADCSIGVDLYLSLEKRWVNGFRLRMASPEFFNGKNGELLDSAGVVHHCSAPRAHHKRATRKSIATAATNDATEPTNQIKRKTPSVETEEPAKKSSKRSRSRA